VAVERSQKIENLSTDFRAKVGQSTAKSQKMPNFKPPYLPQMGDDFPQTKIIFLSVTSAIRDSGQVGGEGPKPKIAKTPKFRPPLLEFHEINFRQIFSIVRAPA